MNGPEMAFCVQRRGAALSSVSMLAGKVGGSSVLVVCRGGWVLYHTDT